MEEIQLLKKRIERERRARKEAESILEVKAIELFKANRELKIINQDLEKEIARRSSQLYKSEFKYRSIIENMELGLLEIDKEGTIIQAFDTFNEMTGYLEGELVGRNFIETLLVSEFVPIFKEQEEKREHGEADVSELKIFTKDREEIWVIVSGAPIFDNIGNIIGSVGIYYDITERKNLEDRLKLARQTAVQAQQAEKQFLASMSHEIRTPLNAIIGMTHMLSDTVLDETQQDYLEVLSSSASILKNLISDILDISKIDAGKLEVNPKVINLKAETHKLINIFKAKTRESKAEFKLDFDDRISHLVHCDQQLLNQVLINLLGNSEKFTKDGTITLRISLKASDTTRYIILFEVVDTGIGMSPLELEKIFVQFVQANVEIRKNYGGTGLGLTICKRLVELMGGYIDVSSQQGVGTNFYFTLNLEISEKEADLEIMEGASVLSKMIDSNLDILIAEDNEMNIKYIDSLLKKWNINHEIAYDGRQAVEKYKAAKFDIVLMDLNMPEMDGFEATRQIREMEGVHSKIPIVALTASTFLSKKHLALQAGMTDFLSKPFTPEQLAEVISKYTDADVENKETVIDANSDSPAYHSALNNQHLLEVYGNDMDYALSMFETFIEIIDDELTLLINYAETDQKEELKGQAHKVKPTFAMVGLNHITDEMQEFEDSVMELSFEKAKEKVYHFEKEIKKFIPIIKSEISRIKNL